MNELNNILTAEEYKILNIILSKIANHTIDDKRIISYNTALGTITFTDTEQKQIDINKACDAFAEIIDSVLYSQNLKQSAIESFRRIMEE